MLIQTSMREPNVGILGLRFNDLAYLLANTVEIKYSSVIDNIIFKKSISPILSSFSQKSSSEQNIAFLVKKKKMVTSGQ